MKKTLFLVTMVLVFTLLFPVAVPAYSGIGIPKYSKVPTEGRPAENPNIGYGYLDDRGSVSTSSAYLIATATSKLMKISPTQVSGYAMTSAISVVDAVSYDMVFQIWDGSGWVYYASITNVANNTIQVSGSHICNVHSKQYYRIKVTHRAKKGSDITETITYSEYIYAE